MSAEWKWYVTRAGDWDAFGFESDTREEAIAAFVRDEGYIEIEVCEARFSTAKRYEGADYVPFAAVRNKERFMPGPAMTRNSAGIGRGEELAARLSDGQRALLATLPLTGKGNPPEGHWVLWDARLAHCQITGNDEASRWSITLTELGRAALRARQPQQAKD